MKVNSQLQFDDEEPLRLQGAFNNTFMKKKENKLEFIVSQESEMKDYVLSEEDDDDDESH